MKPTKSSTHCFRTCEWDVSAQKTSTTDTNDVLNMNREDNFATTEEWILAFRSETSDKPRGRSYVDKS